MSQILQRLGRNNACHKTIRKENTYRNTVLKKGYSRSQSAQQVNTTGSVVRSLRLTYYNLSLRPALVIQPNLRDIQVQKLAYSDGLYNQKTMLQHTTSSQQSSQFHFSIHTTDCCI